MICPIVTSPFVLQIKSADATPEDSHVGRDLKDTLEAHTHECVGMAANMIGIHKRIIAVCDGPKIQVMYNPEIITAKGPYQTSEGCLSLCGMRQTTRYQTITVSYLDESFKTQTKMFSDFAAQIIQHEIDHCNGILI